METVKDIIRKAFDLIRGIKRNSWSYSYSESAYYDNQRTWRKFNTLLKGLSDGHIKDVLYSIATSTHQLLTNLPDGETTPALDFGTAETAVLGMVGTDEGNYQNALVALMAKFNNHPSKCK